MSVPFRPEPVGRMRGRYSSALEAVYDEAGVVNGTGCNPADCRSSVFDWHDGFRVVVWRERDRRHGGRVRLHFSASFMLDGAYARNAAALHPGHQAFRAAFLRAALFRFRELSRDLRAPSFTGFDPGMVPHWHIEDAMASAEAV